MVEIIYSIDPIIKKNIITKIGIVNKIIQKQNRNRLTKINIAEKMHIT